MSMRVYIPRFFGAVLIALGGGTALAQQAGPDGAWLDKFGRYTTIQFGGGQPMALQPGSRQLSDYMSLFKDACLDRQFGSGEPSAAVQSRDWGFKKLDASVPSGKVSADLSGWQSADVSVRSSAGVFFAPNPQCSVTAALATPLSADDVEAAVTAVVGAGPANIDKKLDGKGGRRRFWEPMWIVRSPTSVERNVYARIMTNAGASRLHLGVLEAKGK